MTFVQAFDWDLVEQQMFVFCIDIVTCILYGGRLMMFLIFRVLSPFCSFLIDLYCTFSIFRKYYLIMFIIIVFRLGNDRPFSCFFCRKGSVTGCDSLLGERWMICHFLIIQVHFLNWISLCVFHLLPSAKMPCLLLLCMFNKLFSCIFPGFQLFPLKGSVTGCDSSLGYSPVHFISHSRILFYYYNIRGVTADQRVFRWFGHVERMD